MTAKAPAIGTVTATQLSVSTTAPTIAPPPALRPIETAITSVLRNVVAPVLSSFLTALQRGLTESPLAWMFLAAARREVGTEAVTEVAPAAMRMAATQVVATAVVNQAPTAVGTFSTANPLTGAVTGKVVATDPEGTTPTITLTTKPTLGTLVYNMTAATFTYTPTAAQRIVAGTNPQAGTIAMTVTVSDGVNKVPVQINIPVSAVPIGVRTDVAGVGGAGAVAATNTRAYVTNRDAGTVTVIDTVTATVVGTYAAGVAPDGLAVKQDGTRLYVSSSTKNTVTVLDTATGAVKATIAVAKPTAITMAPGGASVYVTSYDTAKVLRISTSTNTVATTTTLPTGYRPTGIAASPDNTRVYVTTDTPTGGTAVLTFGPTSTTTTQLTQLASKATSLTVSPDNGRLYVGTQDGTVSVIDTRTRALIGVIQTGGLPAAAVAVSGDGSTLMVIDAAGRVGAFNTTNGGMFTAIATRPTIDISQSPGATVSPDGTELYVTDRPAGVVHVVSLTAPNANPVAGTATKGAPNATTGAITGTVGVTDPNGDPLSYTVSGAPTNGKRRRRRERHVHLHPDRGCPARRLDGRRAVERHHRLVHRDRDRRQAWRRHHHGSPSTSARRTRRRRRPSSVGAPNSSTGVVTGNVKGTDLDNDVITYAQSAAPTKGTVTLTATGGFTYTPTAIARHAAQKLGATAADKQDTFTIAVNDGHGGVVTTSVTVTISPTNAAPTGGNGTVTQVNSTTGTVTGVLSAVDLDGDKLTFTSAPPQKGTLAIGANGSFTYTPTTAARDAASAPNAAEATKAEAIAITVADGYGGTATFTLTAPITPYTTGNRPPVTGVATVSSSSSAIGTVTGTVVATDPDGDALTYTVTGGPTKGVVKVNAVTGAYTYTPTVDARYTALVTPGVDTDVFTVTVKDALGASTTTTVSRRDRAARGERHRPARDQRRHSRAGSVVLLAGRDRHGVGRVAVRRCHRHPRAGAVGGRRARAGLG